MSDPAYSDVPPFEADREEADLLRSLRYKAAPDLLERRRLRRASIARAADERGRKALARRFDEAGG